MAILAIARLTLHEVSRRRLVLAVVVLTIAIGILSGWAFNHLLSRCRTGPGQACSQTDLKLIASAMLILLMFMFSFVLALGAAFLAAPSIASDVESGVVLAMLPRPIRRSDLVLGKWLGLSVFIAIYASLACGLEFILSKAALNYTPPHPLLAIVFIVTEAIIVLTLAMVGSTRMPGMTCGIIVLVLFGMTWMGGIAGAVGTALHSRAIENIGTLSSLLLPTDGLWRAAIYNLEPVALVVAQSALGPRAAGNPFFVASPPTTAYTLWAIGWLVLVLSLATWSFSRREL